MTSGSDLPEHISIWGELADTDHELRHVDVGGVRTRVLRAGSGPDLVLLHGTGGHLEAYARDIAGLAADFRVTAYDMVGHGWSGLPDQPYTIDVLCAHLIGLLDALGIAAAHLSGESLGGWVAAWAAAWHPDRVGRLVLNTPGNIANKPEVMARLREHAADGSPRSALRRRKLTFTAVTAGSPPRRVRRGPCARAGSALTPPEPQVARLPRSNGWDLACGDADPG